MSAQPHSGALLRVADQLISFDRASTEACYNQITTSGSEECGCTMCQNYIAQRSTAYPQSFLELLNKLGIDPAKEGEVYYLAPTKNGDRLYGGWFFFCGELLETGALQESKDGVSYSVIGPGRMPSPYPEDSFGVHPLALDFNIEIPWVLSAHEDPELPELQNTRSNHA